MASAKQVFLQYSQYREMSRVEIALRIDAPEVFGHMAHRVLACGTHVFFSWMWITPQRFAHLAADNVPRPEDWEKTGDAVWLPDYAASGVPPSGVMMLGRAINDALVGGSIMPVGTRVLFKRFHNGRFGMGVGREIHGRQT